MKRILIINTSERTGGAAIAANRLMNALKKHGYQASMLVRDKQTPDISVSATGTKVMMAVRFLWERLLAFFATGRNRAQMWQMDFGCAGTDITKTDEFQRADVIHLHWVNQGFISVKGLKKIVNSGKKVVVTMHDMWYFTGGCHYAGECDKFQSLCQNCPLAHKRFLGRDLVKRSFNKKKGLFKDVRFVGCSEWITGEAAKAAITRENFPVHIPNAINTDLFAPNDKKKSRIKFGLHDDRIYLLFGSQRITDERKGFTYMVEASEYIKRENPELASRITVVVAGTDSDRVKELLPLEVVSVDYVHDEQSMADLYNAVDIYVTPSLQDNLPNTIMEAMACGLPCVGFRVGGIPEMIEHKQTGYVAEYKNSQDFATGIAWILEGDNLETLGKHAREKVEREYSESRVVRKYSEIYGE